MHPDPPIAIKYHTDVGYIVNAAEPPAAKASALAACCCNINGNNAEKNKLDPAIPKIHNKLHTISNKTKVIGLITTSKIGLRILNTNSGIKQSTVD